MMQSTRRAILDILKRKGQSSVDELAGDMDLTPMGIRQHLMILQRDGLVESTEVRRKTGRPHYVFSLSEQAEELFPKNYHTLLDGIIGEIKTQYGEEALQNLLQSLADKMIARHLPALEKLPLEDRLEEVTKLLSDNGSLAEWMRKDNSYVVKEYNCPYHHVARNHREVCVASSYIVGRLTGVKSELKECVLDGAVSCTHLLKPDV